MRTDDESVGVGGEQTLGPPIWYVVADLALVVAAATLTVALALSYGVRGGPKMLRVPLGFLFIFLLPGYAVTAALFPRVTPERTSVNGPQSGWVTMYERLILSVGLSIIVVPLVALTLTMLDLTITLRSVMLSNWTVLTTVAGIAAVRRSRQHPLERFHLPVEAASQSLQRYFGRSTVNVVIVVLLLVSVAGLGFAAFETDNRGQYTEFALLSPQGYEAGEYPQNLSANDPETFRVEIQNREGEAVRYTGVVLLEELAVDGGGVVSAVELDRFEVRLGPGQRTVYEHQPRPSQTGDQLRLTYLLYRGDPPPNPSQANAYRAVYLNVEVTAS